jgi:hypothetical protein
MGYIVLTLAILAVIPVIIAFIHFSTPSKEESEQIRLNNEERDRRAKATGFAPLKGAPKKNAPTSEQKKIASVAAIVAALFLVDFNK